MLSRRQALEADVLSHTARKLSKTLHGQLFLLAYHRRRDRCDGDDRWHFGLALRTAMLAHLYLGGHLTDDHDKPRAIGVTRPDDPVLCAANEPTNWMQAVHCAISANDTTPYPS
jgi:hypothetical protein